MSRKLNLIVLCLIVLSVVVGCALINQRKVSDLYAENVSAIVSIINEDEGYGTGFIIDSQKGLIISAFHLIDEKQSIEDQRFRVRFQTNKFEIILFGDIITFDKQNDIILIKFDPKEIRHLKIPKLKFALKTFIGERVYCIGNPAELLNVVSFGIMSSGFIFDDNINFPQPYQISDIHIINGNSGSPVFNFENKVVGMVVRYFGSYTSLVPSTSIEKFINDNVSN